MSGVRRRTSNSEFLSDLSQILESANINFLLGAGCSVPAFGTLGNIEELRTLFASDATVADARTRERMELSIDAEFFMSALYPNCSLNDESNEKGKKTIDHYIHFCDKALEIVRERESVDKAKQITFFTSNYDICLDLALDLLRVPTNSGYSGRFNPSVDLSDFGRRAFTTTLGFGYQAEIPSANIVKIHGCVSWRNDNGNLSFINPEQDLSTINELIAKLKDSSYLCEIDTEISAEAAYKQLKTGCKKTDQAQSDDVEDLKSRIDALSIVFPNKTKFSSTVLNEAYYAQLRRLTNQLEVRNSVLLVAGFSFADEHIRSLILRAAATNPTLQILIFCYNKDSESNIINLINQSEAIPNSNIETICSDFKEKSDSKKEIVLSSESLDMEALSALLSKAH